MGNDWKPHIVLPMILGTICLIGIFILSIMKVPVPDAIMGIAIAFGSWAFGAGAMAAKSAQSGATNQTSGEVPPNVATGKDGGNA